MQSKRLAKNRYAPQRGVASYQFFNAPMLRLHRCLAWGDEGPDKTSDLYVSITVKPHSRLHRDGPDLLTTCDIAESIATQGGEIMINNLRSDLKLKIPPGTESGRTFRLSGCGIISTVHDKKKGKLLIIDSKPTPGIASIDKKVQTTNG